MNNEKYFCFVLSKGQLDYIIDSSHGINRMRCLALLVEASSTSNTAYSSPRFSTSVGIGQVVASEVELAAQWGHDRKTVSRIIQQFNGLGFIRTTKNSRTSIHTVLCVSAWNMDSTRILNPNYIWLKDRPP